jgi:hypothetical protein
MRCLRALTAFQRVILGRDNARQAPQLVDCEGRARMGGFGEVLRAG